MPVVAHSQLPTFAELAERGEQVISLDEALRQDIRELHIGLLNMMPDAALRVTEQQYLRLLGSANQIVQIYLYPFTVPGLERDAATQDYIDRYYNQVEELQRDGLDALIITGANVSRPDLKLEPFWEPLVDIVEWASHNVTSVLCSCLATHALVDRLYGIRRRRLATKRWGVFEHVVVAPDHPLLHGTNTRFDVPHSRWNEITSAQMRSAGLQVLIESSDGDFHLGTSADGIRMVFLQGHPEYDTASLLKEYKREISRFFSGELAEIPPQPLNYLPADAAREVRDYLEAAHDAIAGGRVPPSFPDGALAARLDNTWTDTGKAIFNNWLGQIYRLTDVERGVPFMPDVDPDNPLGRPEITPTVH